MKKIYKIINLINNKVYIGQTKQKIKIRFAQHKKKPTNKHLKRAFNKYGEQNFVIEVLEEVSLNKADEREQYWIKYFDSFNGVKGYNETSGGLSYKGKPLCQSHKDLISKARIGKGEKKVQQLNKEDCKIIKTWDSVSKAAEHYKVHPSYITAACNLRHIYSSGFCWKFEDEDLEIWNKRREQLILKRKTLIQNKTRVKRIAGYYIIQLDLQTGQKIKTWSSIKEIAGFYNCSVVGIYDCLKKKQKSSNGFGWVYGEQIKNSSSRQT